MMCNICGIEYDTPSMGGPGICPRCDCGNLETGGIKRQQERIAALEAENARLKTALADMTADYFRSRDELMALKYPDGGSRITLETGAKHGT